MRGQLTTQNGARRRM